MEIRVATPADSAALHDLAGRDSSRVPAGELLIAIERGRPLAALSLEDGTVIADPFVRSARAVAALRAYANDGAKPPALRGVPGSKLSFRFG